MKSGRGYIEVTLDSPPRMREIKVSGGQGIAKPDKGVTGHPLTQKTTIVVRFGFISSRVAQQIMINSHSAFHTQGNKYFY